MDIFEWSCSKEFLPKSKKFSGLPKPCKAYMFAYLVDGRYDDVPDDMKAYLQNRDISLNKQKRWELIDKFRNDVQSFNEYDNVKVSALEKRQKYFQGLGRERLNDTKAYHAVNLLSVNDETVVHKYATKAYANELSLTNERCKYSKKSRRLLANAECKSSEEALHDEVEPATHLRIAFVSPCTSVSLKERQRRHIKPWVTRQLNRHVCKANGKNDIVALNTEPWERSLHDGVVGDGDYFVPSQSESDSNDDQHADSLRRPFVSMNEFFMSENVYSSTKAFRKRKRARKSNTIKGNDAEIAFICDNFQMIPTEFDCPVENLESENLKKIFASKYCECSCIPRRFCIDVSNLVKNVLSIAHRNSADFRVHALCVFEVVPQNLKDCNLYRLINGAEDNSDEDDDCETNRIMVWINGLFASKVNNLLLPTLDLKSNYTIEEVVRMAVLLIGTLPAEYFWKNHEPGTSFYNNTNGNSIKLQYQLSEIADYTRFRDIGEDRCDKCDQWLLDNDRLCLARCQHWYCKECWLQHCKEHFSNELTSGTITCLDEVCSATVDYDTLTTILPLTLCLVAKVFQEEIRTISTSSSVDS